MGFWRVVYNAVKLKIEFNCNIYFDIINTEFIIILKVGKIDIVTEVTQMLWIEKNNLLFNNMNNYHIDV